jgi:AraC family transcriptional activator FtrA
MRNITPKWTTSGPPVVALVYDGLCTFEFSIAAEIFGLARPEMGKSWYRFAACTIEPGPLRAHGGLSVQAPFAPRLLAAADLIVVPGWKGAAVPVPDSLIRRLLLAHRRGARLASICSGAFVLAATGLLAGRRATTHWRYTKTMQAAFPDIIVDPDVLYVEDGRLLTSAGSAAGIDLMLHVIRTDFGAEAANSVARRLVASPHRTGGQAQFIERPVPAVRGHELSAFLDRVRVKLAEPWPLRRMAKEVAMSQRTFLRRFGEATGQTPNDWITGVRIEEARRLLERAGTSIEEVAGHCGFASPATLRHHFVMRVGVAPRDYRQRFAQTDRGPRTPRA